MSKEYKNAFELQIELGKGKLMSTYFADIYQTIINAMCDGLDEAMVMDVPFTKADIKTLESLRFKVEVIKTHGILGSGKAEKLKITWEKK